MEGDGVGEMDIEEHVDGDGVREMDIEEHVDGDGLRVGHADGVENGEKGG